MLGAVTDAILHRSAKGRFKPGSYQMTRTEKIARNKAEKRIDHAFKTHCVNAAVDVMDIGKIFAVGHKAIAEGADDLALADAIVTFVATIRKN